MDSSRTGCSVPAQNNVTEALGKFNGKTYVAPNGAVFAPESATAKVARIVMDAQPKMARVKDIIAFSPKAMYKAYPESALSNWFIDSFMGEMEKLVGKKAEIDERRFACACSDMADRLKKNGGYEAECEAVLSFVK